MGVRRTERDVVLLQRALVGRLGIGQRDKRVRFPRRGEAVVVDGRDLGADGERERRLHVLQLERVKHHRLEVALGLLGALERGELLGLDCEHKAGAEA